MEHSRLDIEFIKARYAKARNQFKPRNIKMVFIGEGPPDNLDRYFYFADVKKHDSLFLEVMGVLYPEQKKEYLASRRATSLKEELLERFQEDGYWFISLSEVPCSLVEEPLENFLPSLLERLKNQIDKSIPIILIKANVYDICYAPLVANGYNAYHERIPYPGSGQQGVFREKFSRGVRLMGDFV
ncbi:hypothetical protein [Emticicia sp. C21]|uniref:hypothetical protein n=1 Tax=Emticicia sp. C21 TaxID=2302915 RepID=UPI000E357EDE|nr:hypothetical protein [Emticicia sp. C21]RFS13989.1 hypothetical protein D0T08_23685 [Emticicia sp. C21]